MPDREPRDHLDRALESWLGSERLTDGERRRLVETVTRRAGRPRATGRLRRFGWSGVAAAALILIGVATVTVREILRDRTPPPQPIAEIPTEKPGPEKHGPEEHGPEEHGPEKPGAAAGTDRTPPPIAPIARARPLPTADMAAPVVGEVTDDRGLPLASGSVREVSGGGAIGGVGEIDATGHFMLRGAAGAMTTLLLVRGRNDRLRPALVRYRPGDSFRVELQRAEPLAGTTVDATTEAELTGVEIAIAASWPGGRLDLDRTVSIDGRFELPPLPTFGAGDGTELLYSVRIARPGYVTRLHRFAGARALEHWLRAPIRLAAAGGVAVSVRTPDGRPLPGAVVQLIPGPDHSGLFTYRAPDGTRTKASGRARFERVPAGALLVRITHPDALAPVEERLTVSPNAERHVAFVCDVGAEVAGRTTDSTGRVLAGAIVFAVTAPPIDGAEDPGEDTTQRRAFGPVPSDANGIFRLRGLPPGRYAIHVYAHDRDGTSYVPARPLVRTGDRPIEIALDRSRVTLWLEVHEAATSRAVGTFALVLLGPGGRVIRRAVRRGGGLWSVDGIDPTTTAVQVLAPGYLASRLCRLAPERARADGRATMIAGGDALAAAGSRFARIELDRPAAMHGIVVDQGGRPVAGVELARTVDDLEPIRPDGGAFHGAGHARKATSTRDGRFFLGGLDARVLEGGTFWLRIRRPGVAPFRYDLPALRPGQTLRELTIVVP